MDEEFKPYIKRIISKGIRLDGRGFTEYRKPIKVEYGIAKNAEGSARVQIGDTIVFVGVKMEVVEPYPDTPDEGCLIVGAELLPLSNPKFEPGPPGPYAIELARVVDRSIREAKAIDMKALCIEPGKKAWAVIIDIIPINASGNLFDAAALGALAALRNARFPAYDGEKIDYKTKTEKRLPLRAEPISITVIKIGNQLLIDPIPEEEDALDARLTVASLPDKRLCSLQKGGTEPLTEEDIDRMIDLALEKSKELRAALK